MMAIMLWNMCRTGCQKKSRRQLYMQLSSRGVDKESIEDALEAYADEQENTVRPSGTKASYAKAASHRRGFFEGSQKSCIKGISVRNGKKCCLGAA